MESNLTRHFSLLREERKNILWRGHEAVSLVGSYEVHSEMTLINHINTVKHLRPVNVAMSALILNLTSLSA